MISSKLIPRTFSICASVSRSKSNGRYFALNSIWGSLRLPELSRLLDLNALAIFDEYVFRSERFKVSSAATYGVSTSRPISYSHIPSVPIVVFLKLRWPSIVEYAPTPFSVLDIRETASFSSKSSSRVFATGSSSSAASFFLDLELVNTNCFPCSLMLLYVVAVSTTQRDSLAPRMSCTLMSKVCSPNSGSWPLLSVVALITFARPYSPSVTMSSTAGRIFDADFSRSTCGK
mmetsp:Transcript_2540/g.9818  ORF Transcript_2540/g.9818 Transcript_2540/m.9818 type:complete len:232 (+) Transcript_2540:1105-1800(+)